MHQAMQYFCPDRNCERASRGFAREYNMADHIARVHKELDPGHFLKKTKRSKKGQSSSVVSGGSTVVAETKPSRSRGSGKPRRQAQQQQQQLQQQQQQHHFERQFLEHQETATGLWSQIHDPRSPDNLKYIHELQNELGRLEEAYLNLHDGGAGND